MLCGAELPTNPQVLVGPGTLDDAGVYQLSAEQCLVQTVDFFPPVARDPEWKDAQIFSPRPQPASGGSGQYKVNPRQRLLRLDFAVDPRACREGENSVRIRLSGPPKESAASQVALEKLEVHLT